MKLNIAFKLSALAVALASTHSIAAPNYSVATTEAKSNVNDANYTNYVAQTGYSFGSATTVGDVTTIVSNTAHITQQDTNIGPFGETAILAAGGYSYQLDTNGNGTNDLQNAWGTGLTATNNAEFIESTTTTSTDSSNGLSIESNKSVVAQGNISRDIDTDEYYNIDEATGNVTDLITGSSQDYKFTLTATNVEKTYEHETRTIGTSKVAEIYKATDALGATRTTDIQAGLIDFGTQVTINPIGTSPSTTQANTVLYVNATDENGSAVDVYAVATSPTTTSYIRKDNQQEFLGDTSQFDPSNLKEGDYTGRTSNTVSTQQTTATEKFISDQNLTYSEKLSQQQKVDFQTSRGLEDDNGNRDYGSAGTFGQIEIINEQSLVAGIIDSTAGNVYGVVAKSKVTDPATSNVTADLSTELTANGVIVKDDINASNTTITAQGITTGELSTSGLATLGSLEVNGTSKLNSLDVTNDTNLNGLLNVVGATSLQDSLTVAGLTTLNTLNVNEKASFNKGADVTGSFTVNNVTTNVVITSAGTPATVPTFGADIDGDGRPDTLLQDKVVTDAITETKVSQLYNENNLTFSSIDSVGTRTTTDKYIADIVYDAAGVATYGANKSLGNTVTNDLVINSEDTIIVGKETTGSDTALTIRRTDSQGTVETLVKADSITTGTVTTDTLVVDGRDLATELTTLDAKVDTEVVRLDADVAAVNGRVDTVEASVTALDTKVDTEVARLDADVAAVNSRVDTVEASVTALDTKVDTEVARLDADVAAVNGRVDTVEASVTTLDTKVDTEVARLDTDIAKVDAKVDTVVTDLTQTIVDGDAVTLTSANTYTDVGLTTAANDRAEIRKELALGDVATLTSANTYTDTTAVAIRTELAAGDAATLTVANSYTDTKAAEVLTAANAHTNTTATTIRTELAAGDAATLAKANTYTDTQISTVNSNVNRLGKRLDDVEETAYRGVAISLAAAQQVPNIKPGQFAIFGGVGHYEGESAVAFGGVAALSDGRTSISAALGTAGSEVGGRVGVSYVFGGQ